MYLDLSAGVNRSLHDQVGSNCQHWPISSLILMDFNLTTVIQIPVSRLLLSDTAWKGI